LEGTDTDEVTSDFLNILNEAACKTNILNVTIRISWYKICDFEKKYF
jgi:hypothetical protein